MKILLIDNYDSFIYNLVYLTKQVVEGHVEIDVYRNDHISVSEAALYDKIIVGPGPGIPEEAGNIIPIITRLKSTHSILGVCLGHQAIAQVYGAKITQLSTVYHGVESRCQLLLSDPLYADVADDFFVGRYHSWAVESCPESLEIIAQDRNGINMSIRHKTDRARGVQFHPESILTPVGAQIMHNYIYNPAL